jgi:hypothetical protein
MIFHQTQRNLEVQVLRKNVENSSVCIYDGQIDGLCMEILQSLFYFEFYPNIKQIIFH